jgi:hypothetical protein
LYSYFAGYGLYEWNGSAWSQLTTLVPTSMVAEGSVLYVDFAGYGLYAWNGSSFSLITATHPASMVAGF